MGVFRILHAHCLYILYSERRSIHALWIAVRQPERLELSLHAGASHKSFMGRCKRFRLGERFTTGKRTHVEGFSLRSIFKWLACGNVERKL